MYEGTAAALERALLLSFCTLSRFYWQKVGEGAEKFGSIKNFL